MSSLTFQLPERPVERLAEVAALSVPGCIDLDAKLAGLAGRSFPRVIAQLDRRAGTASFEAEIATSYPCPIADVTEAVRAAIISHVETLTGLEVTRVAVNVANVRGGQPRGRVTVDEVANHSVRVVPTPILVQSSSAKLVSTTVAPRQALAPIRVRDPHPVLDSVQVPDPRPLREVHTPDAHPLLDVQTPQPPAVQESFALPAPAPLSKISIKPTRNVDVHTPPAPRVRKVVAPAPRPVLAPRAPAPQPLKRITIQPLRRGYVVKQ